MVAKVVRGLLHATADVPDHHLLEGWAGDPLKRLPARLVVLDNGIAVETLTFKAAYCVGYDEEFESGNEHLGAYVCHFTLSDPDGWTWERGRGPNAYLNVPSIIPTPPPVPKPVPVLPKVVHWWRNRSGRGWERGCYACSKRGPAFRRCWRACSCCRKPLMRPAFRSTHPSCPKTRCA
ncbi:hypothetical protein [Hymenobacter terrenus]|uniref:hypothetical protein n=1 Tax=Hymenobacter terrenus TaxID=1629124 RepID=UPI0012E09879|nr:hypothetical protein [Hymenobacter terrenus]